MRLTAIAITITLLLLAAPAQAHAQTQDDSTATTTPRKWPPFGIGVGAGVREVIPTGDSTSNYVAGAPIFRFIPRNYRSGLVPAIRIGFARQKTTLIESSASASASGGEVQAGSVYLRPFTLGLGWSQPVANQMAIVVSGTAGYAWNGTDATDNGRGHPQLRVPPTVVDVGNSFAWDVAVRAWWDVNRHVSLMGGASFLATSPDLHFADGSTRAWNANQLRLEAGIAFTVLQPLHSPGRRR